MRAHRARGEFPRTQDRANRGATAIIRDCLSAFDRCDFSAALSEILFSDTLANKLIVEKKPGDFAKSATPSDHETLRNTLYEIVQRLHTLLVILYPVMPATATKLWGQLGQSGEIQNEPVSDSMGIL